MQDFGFVKRIGQMSNNLLDELRLLLQAVELGLLK